VVNARDAMPQGGTITITTENTLVSQADCRRMPDARPGRFVQLTLADTGTGMDDHTLQHLFEPFYTTKAPGTGTGLGLAVVYGIIAQHKGWIHVESTRGQGSTFTLFFPADTRPAQEEENAAPSPASMRGCGETVLFVEDSRELMEFCSSVLRQNGYTVITAENFAEGLRAFEKNGAVIRALFSDIMLPDRSGIELAQDLRSRSPGLPVILTSGYADQPVDWSDIQGNCCFLQKPFSIVALLQALHKALSGQC
jgi:two-component system, cell cycle sensor histidine kinase and response regulator CckA